MSIALRTSLAALATIGVLTGLAGPAPAETGSSAPTSPAGSGSAQLPFTLLCGLVTSSGGHSLWLCGSSSRS